jgi:topoisomerase IA-like protein
MKKLIIVSGLFVSTAAVAQQGGTPVPDIVLTPQDLAGIYQDIGSSIISMRLPDGSTHAMIDGTYLRSVLETKIRNAQVAAAKKAEEEAAAKKKAAEAPKAAEEAKPEVKP